MDVDLKVDQKIEIEVKSGPYQGNYNSKIGSIHDSYLKILIPSRDGKFIPLRRDLQIDVFFTGDRAAYKFNSRILGRERENDRIPLLIIAPPDKVERIQRRNYFRIEAMRDIKYRPLPEEDDKEDREDYRESVTIDISGGGVRIAVDDDEEIDRGDLLEVIIDIPEIEDRVLRGEVVNIYSQEDGKSIGVCFVDIDMWVQDTIVGWIFDYQRELRKKGLL